MDEKLVFRRARPADAARIMEIIRQAQAQMRALGSLQWQDGYPAAADIGHDIACGYGWVFEKPEAEKSPEARGSDGTGAAGFRPETAAARKITDTGEAGRNGIRRRRNGSDDGRGDGSDGRNTQSAGDAGDAGSTGDAGDAGSKSGRSPSPGQRRRLRRGGIRRGTGLRRHRRGLAHRRGLCRTAPHGGDRRRERPRGGDGVHAGASKRWRAGAARAVCASTPISTTVTCCVCSGGWGSSIAGRYATGAANGWHSRKPSGHEGIKRGNRPHGRFPLQDECVTMS